MLYINIYRIYLYILICKCIYMHFVRVCIYRFLSEYQSSMYISIGYVLFIWCCLSLRISTKLFYHLLNVAVLNCIYWSVSTSELSAFVSHKLVFCLTHRRSLPQSLHHPAVWTAQHWAVFLRCWVLISILSDKNYMLSMKLSKTFSNSPPLPAASS